MFKLIILTVASLQCAICVTLSPPPNENGNCPKEKSMENLDMRKMMGEWFVYEMATMSDFGEFSKPVSCQSFIVANNSESSYILKSIWGDSRFKFIFNYNVIDEDRPIKYISKTSLSTNKIEGDTTIFLNEAVDEIKMAVLATDYENVAVLLTCEQEESFTRKVYVLRRLRNSKSILRMEKILIGNMYSKLNEYGFELENLQEVDQDNC